MFDQFKRYAGDALAALGNLRDKGRGVVLAAEEAVPAITSGLLGQGKRYDTEVSPELHQGVLDAYHRSKSRGSDVVDYVDYDTTPGGYAARLTMGKMGHDEFITNDDGSVAGYVQRYDTDKTPLEALSEFRLFQPNTWYKPAEAALAISQKGGITDHVIMNPKPKPLESKAVVSQSEISKPAPVYSVKGGDTLTSIANQYGLTVNELAQKNKLDNINFLSVGQQLKL